GPPFRGARKILGGRTRLRAHVLLHALWTDLGAVNVAVGVGRHAFRRARGRRLLNRIRNERRHRSIARAADTNAALPAIMIARDRFGFGIGDVDDVALVDVDAARAAEL